MDDGGVWGGWLISPNLALPKTVIVKAARRETMARNANPRCYR